MLYIKEHIPFLSDVELQKIQMYLDYIIDTTSETKLYESKVRELGLKLLTLIYKLVKDSEFELDIALVDFIENMLKSEWKDAYSNSMIYRVIPEHIKSFHIKQHLPFLKVDEVAHVKKCLDYICKYASC